LLQGLRQRDRLALTKLLSLAARGESVDVPVPATKSLVVAFTGSGGVGKSSLIGKLIDVVRQDGASIAVLACDPQSPVTGGALLGDRLRMGSHLDDGVFIRSLATAGGHGAIAEHLPALIRVLQAFGFDVIFVETVGAGQGDTAVRGLADVLVVLLQPESGDDLQWEKAGILEVADIVAVHKADLAGADHTVAQLHAALPDVPVLKVSAKTGEGVTALWQEIRQPKQRP
jgi:LAO/AO transport system ATPase